MCRRLRLQDIISSSYQRLTKYPLLLEGIQKNTPSKSVTSMKRICYLSVAVTLCTAPLISALYLLIFNMTGKVRALGKLKKDNKDLKKQLEEVRTRLSDQVSSIRQADNICLFLNYLII